MIKKSRNPAWYSSYQKNNYGELFYALVRIYRPQKVVELGVKAGYSAYHLARALQANGQGLLEGYDLWEDYQFNSVGQAIAEENLKQFSEIVQLHHQNAIGVDKLYQKIDILHVDLSNDGAILDAVIPHWIDKVSQLIVIEGGSIERDQVDWMINFTKKPIKKWLEDFAQKRGDIQYMTIAPFPSVTIIRKK